MNVINYNCMRTYLLRVSTYLYIIYLLIHNIFIIKLFFFCMEIAIWHSSSASK